MAASAATTLREKIAFNFNLAYTVTLESHGTEQEGRNGTEFRYFLDNHQIMWVPPEANAQIERATGGEPTGETFTITRRKTGKGSAEWEVVHHDDSAPAEAPAPAPRRQPAPTPAPAPATRPAAQPTAATMPANGPMSTTLYTSLCAAIRTAAAAEEFATSIGRRVAFETADIRAMAATLYIRATEGATK